MRGARWRRLQRAVKPVPTGDGVRVALGARPLQDREDRKRLSGGSSNGERQGARLRRRRRRPGQWRSYRPALFRRRLRGRADGAARRPHRAARRRAPSRQGPFLRCRRRGVGCKRVRARAGRTRRRRRPRLQRRLRRLGLDRGRVVGRLRAGVAGQCARSLPCGEAGHSGDAPAGQGGDRGRRRDRVAARRRRHGRLRAGQDGATRARRIRWRVTSGRQAFMWRSSLSTGSSAGR